MLLGLHKDVIVISMTSTQWGRCGLLLTSIRSENCQSVLTRFFFACEWGTSGIMLSNACKGKKWCETLPLSQSRGAMQDFLCHCLVSEYCHVCDAIRCNYIGKCALTVDRGDEADAGILLASCRKKRSFHLNRQVNAKSKRNIGQSGVCVCSQQEDSTCAPKTGGCVWLWHWSLHRAVHQQAWPWSVSSMGPAGQNRTFNLNSALCHLNGSFLKRIPQKTR